MKKVIILLLSLIVINSFFSMSSTQATTQFIKHTYNKNQNVQYYSIKGTKYSKVNSKMKADAKAINKKDLENKKIGKQIKSEYPLYDKLKPTIKYQSGNRISILAKESWYCASPYYYMYHGYNLVNGKQITLKQAFKSKDAYKKANLQIAKKINKIENTNQFNKKGVNKYGKTAMQLVDAFYWTKKGLYVVYNTSKVASVAAQQQIFKINNKYAKYYK